MNTADIVVIIILAIIVSAAIGRIIYNKKQGKMVCGCSIGGSCSGNCKECSTCAGCKKLPQ